MTTPPDMAKRHARILARLSHLGLLLAEQTFADADAAETPAERIEAVKAFHTISRSVRQSVALEARLARQQAQDLRDAERVTATQPPREPDRAASSKRTAAPRDASAHLAWRETEDEDYAEELEDRLGNEALDDHIARLCLQMGLPEDAVRDERDPRDPNDDPADDAVDRDFSVLPAARAPELTAHSSA